MTDAPAEHDPAEPAPVTAAVVDDPDGDYPYGDDTRQEEQA